MSEDEPRIFAGDPEGRTPEEERARVAEAVLRDAFASFFTSPTGKQCLDHLIRYCRFTESVFDPNPIEMAYREGRRNVILEILRLTGELHIQKGETP